VQRIAYNENVTAEPIELPVGTAGGVDSRNHVSDGRAHLRQLANTVERLCAAAVCGSATQE